MVQLERGGEQGMGHVIKKSMVNLVGYKMDLDNTKKTTTNSRMPERAETDICWQRNDPKNEYHWSSTVAATTW